MESIQDILQCKWCLSQLSDPVILPCGDTVCRKHTEELRLGNWSCVLCNGIHRLAEDEQFLVNKIVLTMLRANLSELDFGPTYNDAKDRVQRLNTKQAELKHIIKQPGDFVSTHFRSYRNQVDLACEELKELVDEVCLDKRKEIDALETKATQAIVEKKTAYLVYLDQTLDRKITSWKKTLNKLVVNESLWKEMIKDTNQYEEELDKQLASAIHTPSAISKTTTMSICRPVWAKLSERMDKLRSSISIRDLSTIAKSKSCPEDIHSETFTFEDHVFDFLVDFTLSDEKLFLGVHLQISEITKRKPVKVSWTINILGQNSQLIKSKLLSYVFKEKVGYGCLFLLSDILAHPAYDAQEDMISVQVVKIKCTPKH